jgi:hypothetical protein
VDCNGRTQGKSLTYLLPFFALTALFVPVGPRLYRVLKAIGKAVQRSSPERPGLRNVYTFRLKLPVPNMPTRPTRPTTIR